MKKIPEEIIGLLSVIILFGFLGYGLIHYKKFCDNNPRKCKVDQQLKCEDAGGLYLTGGFGSPNCVFPSNKMER